MLKSNNAQVIRNIRRYILDGFNPEGYDGAPSPLGANGEYALAQFPQVAKFIMKIMMIEKQGIGYPTRRAMFEDWANGLPSILDTCYYYNRSAVHDVAAILGETPREASRFDEFEATTLLDTLIFRELEKGANER